MSLPNSLPNSQPITRLQQLMPLLACPACRGHLEPEAERLQCQHCGASYRVRKGVPVLLCEGDGPDDIEVMAGETPESKHPYGPRSEAIIAAHERGWVLDLGSGAKLDRREHVVQMDIFRYPMVDVVGSATTLPFRDNAFDAVISQAVFEHLQYPEQAAAEIHRVLKPHGVLKIDTAFLQPEHGYPHHYFNATERGLRHWFRDFDIEWSGVEAYQHPLWALSWFVDLYAHYLPEPAASDFMAMTIGEMDELIKKTGAGGLSEADGKKIDAFVAIPPEGVRRLASGVTILGRNPQKMVASPVQSSEQTVSDNMNLRWQAGQRLTQALDTLEYQNACLHAQAQYLLLLEDQARYLARFYPGTTERLCWRTWLVRSAAVSARKLLPTPWWFALRSLYLERVRGLPTQGQAAQQRAFVTFVMTPEQVTASVLTFFSLTRQTYSAWQLLLIETPAQGPDIRRVIHEFSTLDERVSVCRQDVASMRSGEFLAVLHPDSTLDFSAIEEFVTLYKDRPQTTTIRCNHGRRLEGGRAFHCVHGPLARDGEAMPAADGGLVLRRAGTVSAETPGPDEYAYIDKVLYHRHPNFLQFR